MPLKKSYIGVPERLTSVNLHKLSSSFIDLDHFIIDLFDNDTLFDYLCRFLFLLFTITQYLDFGHAVGFSLKVEIMYER